MIGLAIHPAAGILALVSAVAFGTTFFVYTKARYKSIAKISDQIDLVLHNADHQFGILMSVGATEKQLRNSVLFEGLCIGTIGIPIAF